MRRISGLVIIVVLAASGIAAASAPAASKLTLSEEGIVTTAGQTIEMYGYENVTIRSSAFDIECPDTEAGMRLEVLTNSAAKDELRVLEYSGIFNGNGLCATGSSFGPVDLGFSAGPLTLTAKGKAKLPASFDLQFRNELEQCHYAKTLRGTNTNGSIPAPLQVTFPNQGMKRQRAATNSPGCPGKIEVSISLPFAFGEEGRVEAAT